MKKRRYSILILSLMIGSIVFLGCGNKNTEQKDTKQQSTQMTSSQIDGQGTDPRAAFETSNLLSGLNVEIKKLHLIKSGLGSPRSGVALGYGSTALNAVVACTTPNKNEKNSYPIEQLFSAGYDSSVILPGTATALTISGETIVVSCSNSNSKGNLLGYRFGDTSGSFIESWKRGDKPKTRILPIPGARIASGGEDGLVTVNESADGHELWKVAYDIPIADLAYAPGTVIAAAGKLITVHDETNGKKIWNTTLESNIISLSAGSGVLAALRRDGVLETFVLADGAPLCNSVGPYDASIRPIVDYGRVIAALPRGGAREIELKAGTIIRSWIWEGQTSCIVADTENLYAAVSGITGPRVIIAPRSANGEPRLIALPSPVFDAPMAVNGSRGGLLFLLRDGSIALMTGDTIQNNGDSAIDKAVSPPEPVASAITTALGRFRQRSPTEDLTKYIRFDLFVSGMPVDTNVAFTVFKFTARESKMERFIAEPASLGIIIAAYTDEGSELEANIDELGSKAGVDIRVQKGKTYWIAAGRTSAAEGAAFRIFER